VILTYPKKMRVCKSVIELAVCPITKITVQLVLKEVMAPSRILVGPIFL
jgi:hypothetical protein